MTNGVTWAPEHVERLCALWNEGVISDEIGKRLGVSGKAVWNKIKRLRKAGKELRKMAAHGWTDARIETARTLWRDGQSATLIAAELHVTRNSVLGKMHRLGESNRGAPKNRKRTVSATRRDNATKMRMRHVKPKLVQVARVAPKSSPDAPISLRLSIMQLTQHTCKWAYGDAVPYEFCGAAKGIEGAFCAFHHAIAYRPAEPRKQVWTRAV